MRSTDSLKKSSSWFWRLIWSKLFVKTIRNIFSNFVCFSESPNFILKYCLSLPISKNLSQNYTSLETNWWPDRTSDMQFHRQRKKCIFHLYYFPSPFQMYLNNLTTNKVYDLKVQAGTRSQVGERLMHFGPFSQVQRYEDNSRGVV